MDQVMYTQAQQQKYRVTLEFDVYEVDSHKVKDLMDKVDKPQVMALVDNG